MEFIGLTKYGEKDPQYRSVMINADEIASFHTFMNEDDEEVTEVILKSGIRFPILEDMSDILRFLDMIKEGKDEITFIESDIRVEEEGWKYNKPFSCHLIQPQTHFNGLGI